MSDVNFMSADSKDAQFAVARCLQVVLTKADWARCRMGRGTAARLRFNIRIMCIM